MSATTLKALIINTVKLDSQLQRNGVELIKQAKGMSLKAWRNTVAETLGEHYEVEPHTSQKFGWLTFEKDTAAEQMLKKFFRLHPKSDAQQSSGKREPVVVAQAKVNAAIKIAQGMTKAEFNAWLKLVRDSVTFK